MQLTEIRESTLIWLDDVNGDRWKVGGQWAKLDFIINEAYRDLVRTQERVNQVWNIYPTPDTVNVTAAAREYALAAGVRRPLDVVRTDNGQRDPVDVILYVDRDRYTRGTFRLENMSRPLAVYFYRSSEGTWATKEQTNTWQIRGRYAKFMMGLVDTEPEACTLEVTFAPRILALRDGGDTPVQLLDEWHDLIPLAAAIRGKTATRREIGEEGALYAAGLANMQVDAGKIRHGAKSGAPW